jgi:NADPH:quinone reductase-like Zn-dependent oxidoreductase
MKAVPINQWGQPLQIEEIAQPSPASDEVLVRVRAASINPMEVFVAAGYLQSTLSAPMTPGTDFAGEVVEVGADVTHVKPGEAVYGFIPFRGGTFAEFVVAKGSEVAPKPKSVNFEQAAAVPLTALAAWQGLFQTAKLQKGERVLIHGVAGGVGSFAAQFARLHGAYVIGTADAEDEAFARQLGIDEFINFKETRFEDQVRDVDVVFATVGGDVIPRSFNVMKPEGRLVTTGQMEGAEEAERRGLQAASFVAQPAVDDLNEISDLIDAGQVKVHITDTLPLEQAQTALEVSQQKEAGRRKVVLSVQ